MGHGDIALHIHNVRTKYRRVLSPEYVYHKKREGPIFELKD
jgi:hypothetical protein